MSSSVDFQAFLYLSSEILKDGSLIVILLQEMVGMLEDLAALADELSFPVAASKAGNTNPFVSPMPGTSSSTRSSSKKDSDITEPSPNPFVSPLPLSAFKKRNSEKISSNNPFVSPISGDSLPSSNSINNNNNNNSNNNSQESANLIPREKCDTIIGQIKNLSPFGEYGFLLHKIIEMLYSNYDNDYNPSSIIDEDSKIQVHKVLKISKQFVANVFGNRLPNSPAITINLLEKQISLFLQITSGSLSNGSISNPLQSIGAFSANPSPSDLSLREVCTFVMTVSIWLIQHSFVATSLISEFGLSFEEVDAIRTIFQTYDTDLSGRIDCSLLPLVLQDMGEDYSDAEMAIVLAIVDQEKSGAVEFAEFIRWWTSEYEAA